MKKFDFILILNLLTAAFLLSVRIGVCILEGITVRNTIGVLVYGFFTDLLLLFLASFLLLSVSVVYIKKLKKIRIPLIIIGFWFYLILIDLQCLIAMQSLFINILQPAADYMALATIVNVIKRIISFGAVSPIYYGQFWGFLIILVGLNFLLYKYFFSIFTRISRLKANRLVFIIVFVGGFLAVTKLGVNTITFPNPTAAKAYTARQNTLFKYLLRP